MPAGPWHNEIVMVCRDTWHHTHKWPFGRLPADWLRSLFEVWAPGHAPTPDNWIWRGPYNMELQEAQNGNHTSHGPQVHSARVDFTSRLPELVASKARCNSMDPGPSRPLSPEDPPTSLTPRLYGFSPAFSLEGVPASPHTPQKSQVPGRTRFHVSLMLRTEFGHLWSDCEERFCTYRIPPNDRRAEHNVGFLTSYHSPTDYLAQLSNYV